MSKYLISALYP